MNDKDIITTCRMLFSTHFFPIVCYKGDKLEAQFCSYESFCKVFFGIKKQMPESQDVAVLSGQVGLYGTLRVKNSELFIIIGPFINKKLTNELLDSLIHDYEMPWNEKDELKQFLLSLPRQPLNRFLNFISLLHFLFNGEELSISDFLKSAEPVIEKDMGEKHTDRIWNESPVIHGTYNFEQQLLSYVSAGDEAGLSVFFENVAKLQPFSEGKVADDTLRQSKNIFIGLICMVGKVGAIRGNLDIEQTYQLIDIYSQECERCTSVKQVYELRYTSIMDFTRRVAEQKHPDVYSNEVYTALQFIKSHTSQPLSAQDVVNHIEKSRSAFMTQFKKETGMTIGSYIINAKLQESKLLLAYSQKTLSEISSFLYFSSQSHFQNQFKKAYGITPLAYRKKRRKSFASDTE